MLLHKRHTTDGNLAKVVCAWILCTNSHWIELFNRWTDHTKHKSNRPHLPHAITPDIHKHNTKSDSASSREPYTFTDSSHTYMQMVINRTRACSQHPLRHNAQWCECECDRRPTNQTCPSTRMTVRSTSTSAPSGRRDIVFEQHQTSRQFSLFGTLGYFHFAVFITLWALPQHKAAATSLSRYPPFALIRPHPQSVYSAL